MLFLLLLLLFLLLNLLLLLLILLFEFVPLIFSSGIFAVSIVDASVSSFKFVVTAADFVV